MRRRGFGTKRNGTGAPELAAAVLCLVLTGCLLSPRGAAALSALLSLRPQQDNGALLLRLAAEDDSSPGRITVRDEAAAPAEPTSVPAPVPGTEAGETEPAPASDAVPAEQAADLAAYRESYLQAHAEATAAGTVRESFFGNGAATDVVGDVGVRNCTSTKKPDFAALLAAGAPLRVPDRSQPTVLVYHTHTTESYLPAYDGSFYADFSTHTTDLSKSVVRVGDAVCAALEAAGIGVIHDTGIYDEAYNGAYARSRATVERILEENPSVLITLDVHRDAIYESDTAAVKPTAEINEKKAAQIMIITGAQEGLVSSFPTWEENLRFALALQKTAQRLSPGLMKPVYFCQRRYNMDETPCSLLLEFGSDTNTLEEAVYAGRLLGEALADLIIACEETQTQ